MLRKTVVEEVEDKLEQISLEDAKEIDSKFELGDIVHIPIESKSSDVLQHRCQEPDLAEDPRRRA